MKDRHPPLAVAWAFLMIATSLPVALAELALHTAVERFGPPKVKLP